MSVNSDDASTVTTAHARHASIALFVETGERSCEGTFAPAFAPATDLRRANQGGTRALTSPALGAQSVVEL